MEAQQLTKTLLEAKKTKGLSFDDLGRIVGKSEVWTAALLYRQASASYDDAMQIASALGQGPDVAEALTEYPAKGLGPIVPTDPLIYRFYEIMQVYGYPLKSIIHEKFGDGIMSAIDFTMEVEKEPNPQGDRVKVTMSGKFLPYKQW